MGGHVTVRDGSGEHAVAFTLDDGWLSRPAADFVLDVLGAPLGGMPPGVSVRAEDGFALKALQAMVFDHDDQGAFIRDGVGFAVGPREIDPDAPLSVYCMPTITDGLRGHACELRVVTPEPNAASPLEAMARLALVHMLAVGATLDVTRDWPELAAVLEGLEREGLTEIDVPRASYKLSAKGEALHREWMREAQDLIKRYDIYGDVDEDPSGAVRFDTGLGQDLRVAVFEHEGRDPFRARFLLGLSDGEWDRLPDWPSRIAEPAWYDEVFAPIEAAPGAAELGRARLERIVAAGKEALRRDGLFEGNR